MKFEIIDNYIPYELIIDIEKFLSHNSYWQFVFDDLEVKHSHTSLGLTIDKENYSDLENCLVWHLSKNFNVSNIERCVRNCYRIFDRTSFHKDPKGLTYMFYVNPKWRNFWGGHTEFKYNSKIIKVCPKPGRLVIFDSQIEHRGTAPNLLMPRRIAGRFSIVFQEGK
jgi:hypothetical protein